VGWVNADVLVALSRHEGVYVWLSCGSMRVMLRLYLNEDSSEDEDEPPSLKIFVPPIVATNLGIFGHEIVSCTLEATEEVPVPASNVILRPLARPTEWPRMGNSNESGEYWIFPRSGILVQPLKLLSAFEASTGKICYYHVLEIKPMENASQPQASCFRISESTIFQLDNSKLQGIFDVPHLPCFISQRNYYQSATKQISMIARHPNMDELTRAFEISSTGRPEERILHAIGSNAEHDLCLAVETAAKRAGRTCWSLRGLAAFAHSIGHPARTGSLVDQLAGLEAALEEIQRRRMEPCVLHLYDVDLELSIHDDPIRREQEDRFWAKFLQAVDRKRTSESFLGVRGASSGQSLRHFTCPLIVLLSTTSPLKPGPWMQGLIFLSIVLSIPDAAYTQFLWDGAFSDDMTMEILRGRTAKEIRKIRNQVANIGDPQQVHQIIQKLCNDDDSRRRKQHSAAVSQVRWEDVGGMAHVRNEIMDAIELPLKHPHLFPNGRGRSGILLYGR